jgi:urease accessory protein
MPRSIMAMLSIMAIMAMPSPATGTIDIIRASDRSVVTSLYATSPLRLLTPRSHGTAAWIYTSSYGGGLLGGDSVRLAVRVGPDARAFVSTQASTKVYRSDDGTSVSVHAHVARGGQLILWPDPVVCYAGSSYVQRQQVDLDAGAGLVLVDAMTSGRRGSGERWRFDRYLATLSIRCDGRLALFDAIDLSPADGDLAARMGRFDVLCTAVVAGAPLRNEADRIVAAIAGRTIVRGADALVAASPIDGVGCLLRIAGRSTEHVAGIVRDQLSFVTSVLGDDPWVRKW